MAAAERFGRGWKDPTRGEAVLTDLLRDHLVAVAWLALMAFAWCGWAQEDPPSRLRPLWGACSVLALALVVPAAIGVVRAWDTPSALDGREALFGLVVLLEVVLCAAGCLLLARRGRSRWFAAWIALVVALHLLPLALLFGDPSYAVLGLFQVLGLLVLRGRMARSEAPTSRWAAPWMGVTFLVFSGASAVILLIGGELPF